MTGSWTSVQIATVAVDALTPLTVAGLGVLFARASRRTEQIQCANHTVVTRRLDIFTQLARGLNQLLCFAAFVGGWQEIQPREAIAIERQLDQTMYARQVLFSAELFTAYRTLMAPCSPCTPPPTPTPCCTPHRVQVREPPQPALVGRDVHVRPIHHRYCQHPGHPGRLRPARERFRADRYVTRQAQPILASQP